MPTNMNALIRQLAAERPSAAPPLSDNQGTTGQEIDLPPPVYDNANGYVPPNTALPRYVPLPIEEYPYDGVPRPHEQGPAPKGVSPMADADDLYMQTIGRWQREVYERGNEIRYTSAGVFEVSPDGTQILSTMPTGVPMA